MTKLYISISAPAKSKAVVDVDAIVEEFKKEAAPYGIQCETGERGWAKTRLTFDLPG